MVQFTKKIDTINLWYKSYLPIGSSKIPQRITLSTSRVPIIQEN